MKPKSVPVKPAPDVDDVPSLDPIDPRLKQAMNFFGMATRCDPMHAAIIVYRQRDLLLNHGVVTYDTVLASLIYHWWDERIKGAI